jgi:hypothetical protein
MMAIQKQPGDAGFYAAHFTRAEMADIDQALGESLCGEIGMLRVAMRRFFEKAAQEADDLQVLADVLQVLGLSCSRLAKMIQTERSLQDKQGDALGEALAQSMAAVLEEMSSVGLNGQAEGGSLGG